MLLLGATACDAQAPDKVVPTQRLAAVEAHARGLPALTGRVVDGADVLNAQAEAALTTRLAALENATTDQVVVVTVPSLEGESIEALGLRLGKGWGIGQKELDNGVLLILAPTERRARIEVGYGLEGLLTDEKAQRIMDEQLVPLFAKGHLEQGLEAGVSAIEAMLRSDRKRPQAKRLKADG
jgi:uncharacterized protein